MASLSTHALDTAAGTPAQRLPLSVHCRHGTEWEMLASGETNDDGRVPGLMDDVELSPGVYKMVFETGDYQRTHGHSGFYPIIEVVFEITDDTHYHVPLLLSPYGYSTYRGS